MFYTSTRDNAKRVESAEAIYSGISPDGGLFIPCDIPKIDGAFIAGLLGKSYTERANAVLPMFLTDFGKEEIESYTAGAYKTGFDSEKTAPVVKLTDKASVLELWHGPTCAFKDMALQLLPYLLTGAAKRCSGGRETVILVATSGDTGKAALEGFADVPGTRILVFYPNDGVSPMQKLQMSSQKGNNVGVCAIYGNFDDAQTGVKKIFTDADIKKTLFDRGFSFSSANSINWGRLVPQIVYYISAYCDMIENGSIKNGDKINFVVPTGNFGNILAAYFAREMGLPVNKLICASNENDVLTEFLRTGRYNRVRPFHTTVSPSMDILISSNLERLLFSLSGYDSEAVKGWFGALSANGEYTVPAGMLAKIKEIFDCGSCDDDRTKAAIAKTWKEYGYLTDTHTAVGTAIYEDYTVRTGDMSPTVIVSTASPYKFSGAVLEALTGKKPEDTDDFAMLGEIEHITALPAPRNLVNLRNASPRFTDICKAEDMREVVFGMLGIQ